MAEVFQALNGRPVQSDEGTFVQSYAFLDPSVTAQQAQDMYQARKQRESLSLAGVEEVKRGEENFQQALADMRDAVRYPRRDIPPAIVPVTTFPYAA